MFVCSDLWVAVLQRDSIQFDLKGNRISGELTTTTLRQSGEFPIE